MGEDIRGFVEEFYASAAIKPVKELCCPTGYKEELVSHIPKEVLDISYGCGSPVLLADIKEGESILDLGSGGGVDCFVAARLAGKDGKVIGVDMTEEMLVKAREASLTVSRNLGFDIAEFRKGLLEEIPVEDEAVDLVTSNCVINLSPDKGRVMSEVFRVLKHGGRFCISDVVAEKDVPEAAKADKRLWGECISGALREDEFLTISRKSGFYGLEITSRYLYREVGGIKFYSINLKGYKFKKGPECVYRGQSAIYNGPFKSVWDDDGHEYPAGIPVEICTDTAEKLKSPPYRGLFTVIDGARGLHEAQPCNPGNDAGDSRCC